RGPGFRGLAALRGLRVRPLPGFGRLRLPLPEARGGLPLRSFSYRTLRPQRAMASTSDDSTIMYTADTNRAGCQTWRNRPKRTAARRSAMVTTQAITSVTEIGAT